LREALVQGLHGLHLFFAAQHPTLELEVLEAIACLGGFGQAHHRLSVHGLFVAKPAPVVCALGLVIWAGVGQGCLAAVAHKEQVTQHLHRIALLAFAE
jgi:hypothetical protein